MGGINLLPKKDAQSGVVAKYRRMAVTAATAGLVVYVAGVAAAIGMWTYLGRKQRQTSARVEGLRSRVVQLAATEAIVRQVAARAGAVEAAMKSREDVEGQLGAILDRAEGRVAVVNWDRDESGLQTLNVKASGAAQLETFAAELGKVFTAVTLKSVEGRGRTDWEAVINLAGKGDKK